MTFSDAVLFLGALRVKSYITLVCKKYILTSADLFEYFLLEYIHSNLFYGTHLDSLIEIIVLWLVR